jgi:MFS family permease
MLPLDVTVVGVALDSIGRDLEASFAGLQWVVNSYNLAFGSLLLTAGTLADLFGRRRMFALGIVVFTLSSLLCGFSQSPLMLNLLRAFQGIGAAFVLTSGTAAIANEFRASAERAKAFGILGSSFGIGLALGPLAGGVFSSGLGWRWIFFVNIPVGLSVLALAVPRMNPAILVPRVLIGLV